MSDIEVLKTKLAKYGIPQVVKEGYVFTILITGELSTNWNNMDRG